MSRRRATAPGQPVRINDPTGREPGLIHGAADHGPRVARYLDTTLRHEAWAARHRSRQQLETHPLCMTCTMTALARSVQRLARDNDWNLDDAVGALADALETTGEPHQ